MGKLGRLVVIAGNICAAKSTVTKELGFEQFLEPSAQDNEHLTDFYDNPALYAEVLQFYIFKKRFLALMKALVMVLMGYDVFIDRSIWDDFIFVNINFITGNFSKESFYDYCQLRQILIDGLKFPSAFVYLDVTVEECLRRNRELRQNACESGLTAEYLQGLEDGYKLIKEEALSMDIPWITLDWNNFGSVETIKEAIAKIENYPDDAPGS